MLHTISLTGVLRLYCANRPVRSALEELGLGAYGDIPALRRPSMHLWGDGDEWKAHSEQLASLWEQARHNSNSAQRTANLLRYHLN